MRKVVVVCLGLVAVIYLLNPGAGLFELIPDNLPLVGNLDEAAAFALLLMCLRYFGLEVPDVFRGDNRAGKKL